MYHRGCPHVLLCLTTQGHRCPWLSVPEASGHLFGTLSWNPLLIERWIPSGRKTACPLANILPFCQSDSTSCFRATHPNLASDTHLYVPTHFHSVYTSTWLISLCTHMWTSTPTPDWPCAHIDVYILIRITRHACTHVHTACLDTPTAYLCISMHTPTLAHTCAEPYSHLQIPVDKQTTIARKVLERKTWHQLAG